MKEEKTNGEDNNIFKYIKATMKKQTALSCWCSGQIRV